MVDSKFNSLLDELCDYAPVRDRDTFVESRALQLIGSGINFLRLISESYDAATAEDLSKRLLRAISSGDEEKFTRRMRSIREAKVKRGKPL